MPVRRQPRDLRGRTVAITGAARGIGAATARALSAAGAHVAIGDLDGDLAESTAASLPSTAIGSKLDVTDAAGFGRFLDDVEDRLGPLDVLINNAGVMPVGDFADASDAAVGQQVDVNLRAVITGSQEAVRRMRPRGSGHIVNIASAAGKGGFPGIATYCATKFGVVGLCEALSAELHGTGVEVSCVMPAVVSTELAEGVASHWMVKTSTPEQVADAIVAALRVPRFEVYVPRSIGPIYRSMGLMPHGAQQWFLRATGFDHLMADAAHSPARADYERRLSGA